MTETIGVKQMDISLDGIGHVLSDKRLAVPIYQRSYAWEEKHVNDLATIQFGVSSINTKVD